MDLQIGRLVVSLGVNTAELDGAGAAVARLERTTSSSFTMMAQRMRTFGYLTSVVLTAPIVAVGKNMIQMGMDFEFSMNKMIGLSSVAKDKMKEYGDTVLAMTKTTATGPKELADTLYFVASSGIKGSEALRVTELAAKGAASGMGEARDVANLLTSAMNAYRASGLTATHMMDVMTATIREGKGEPAEMVKSFGSLMLMGAELGVKIEDLAGNFSLLTLMTNSSNNAATYMRQLLQTIMKPTPGEKDIMSRMGITPAQVQTIFREQGILAGLTKLRDLTKQHGESIAQLFPNQRAFIALLGLTGQNLQYNQKTMEVFNNVTGDFEKHWATMSQTLKVRWNSAIAQGKASMVELGQQIAKVVLPILEKLIEKLNRLVEWFKSLSEEQQRSIVKTLAFIAAIGPLSLLISAVMYSINGLIGVVGRLGSVFQILRSVIVTNPWIVLGTAIAGVVGWLIHMRNKAEEAQRANTSLNTSLVTIQGTMKNLASITQGDLTTASIYELGDIRKGANKAYMDARANALNAMKMAGLSEAQFYAGKSAGKYQKYIDIQVDAAIKAKKLYEDAGKAMDEWATNWVNNANKVSGKAMDEWATNWVNNANKVSEFDPFTSTTDKIKEEKEALERLGWEWLHITRDIDKKRWGTVPMFQPGQIALTAKSKLGIKMPGPVQFMPDLTPNLEAIEELKRKMTDLMGIVTTLEGFFSGLFMTIGKGFGAMVQYIGEELKRLVAQVMTKAVVFGLLALISGGTSGFAQAAAKLIGKGTGENLGERFMDFMFKRMGGHGLASGNFTVPPGYPNDTFHAALTSGETVLTPAQLRNLTSARTVKVIVNGKVSWRDIALIQRRSSEMI